MYLRIQNLAEEKNQSGFTEFITQQRKVSEIEKLANTTLTSCLSYTTEMYFY
jgi:hypothetical protein